MKNIKLKQIKRNAKNNISTNSCIMNPKDVLLIISEYERVNKENIDLKNENHILKERLENYIPRRRVRRIYKQVKKILEQDGITDDLDIE